MALSEAQKLLDELMGRHRNADPNEKTRTMEWAEPDVCRHFLVQFCPHDLFTNTKADLGPCAKIHDDRLRGQFKDEASEEHKFRYESVFIDMCRDLLKDVDKKIQRARNRLIMTAEVREDEAKSEVKGQDAERVQVLNEKIDELLKRMEELGAQEKVDEAQALMTLCDELKQERYQLQHGDRRGNDWKKVNLDQDKTMEVCEVCGAFLIIGDAQSRVDDHLSGKQHVGYSKLRESVVEFERKREEFDQKKRELRGGRGGGGDQRRDHRDRSRDRRDVRDNRGDNRRRNRSRERERSRERDRSRDRVDRYRRDRSRDRRDRRRRSPRYKR